MKKIPIVVFGLNGVLYNLEKSAPYPDVKDAFTSISEANNIILLVIGLGKPSYEIDKLNTCNVSRFLNGTMFSSGSLNELQIVNGFQIMFSASYNIVFVGDRQTITTLERLGPACTTVLIERRATSLALKPTDAKPTYRIKTLTELEHFLRRMKFPFTERTVLDERNFL